MNAERNALRERLNRLPILTLFQGATELLDWADPQSPAVRTHFEVLDDIVQERYVFHPGADEEKLFELVSEYFRT